MSILPKNLEFLKSLETVSFIISMIELTEKVTCRNCSINHDVTLYIPCLMCIRDHMISKNNKIRSFVNFCKVYLIQQKANLI